jgi:hypothetical protein
LIGIIAAVVALGVAIAVRIDPRIPIAFGLLTLASSGVFLAVDQRQVADLLATITFFMLAFGTLLAFIERARGARVEKNAGTSWVESDTLVERDKD